MNTKFTTLLKCRISESEFLFHKKMVKELNVSSQRFLYVTIMNYVPQSDCRVEPVKVVLQVLENVNEQVRKMKMYLDSNLKNLPADVRYWNSYSIPTYLQKLLDSLTSINNLLQMIFEKDPHNKLMREKIRTTKSEILNKELYVRVQPEDKEQIKINADKCMLSVSSYIRLLATGRHPKNREILTACRGIAKIDGDMGRVKGIMHLWLSKDSHLYALNKETKLLIISNAKQAIINQKLASQIMNQLDYTL